QRNLDPIALDQAGGHGEGAVEYDGGVVQVPSHGEVERHRIGVRHRDLETRILGLDGTLVGHSAGHSGDPAAGSQFGREVENLTGTAGDVTGEHGGVRPAPHADPANGA